MPGLVITTDTACVNLESSHIELVNRVQSENSTVSYAKMRVPIFDIDRVVICGRPSISMAAMQKFMANGIPVFFVSSHGRWIGALSPDNNLNASRRIRQYEKSRDGKFMLNVAQKIVQAKIKNSKRVLQRLSANREQSHFSRQIEACEKLDALADSLGKTENLDEIRGYEGMSAAIYFARLGNFFPENIPFKERSRRPPKDAANALLSWTYSIVLGEIDAAVRSHGLDACIGCLHSISHGTPSLSLDLLEPLRAPLCDLLVLNMLNHKILSDESFEFNNEDGGTYLRSESKKDFFFSYENAMTRKFTLAKGENHTDFRNVIEDQVLQFLKALEERDEFNFFAMP